MSDVLNKMKTRRSIRKFKSDMVPQEVLDQIIEAGLYAASGMGEQSPIIIQVTKKELRDEISKMMDDEKMGKYVEQLVYEEIIPSMDYPEDMLKSFAKDVLERFRNPYIKHYLLSILLNSTSKFKARVLPSLLQYANQKGELPTKIVLSLACLLWVYRDGVVEGNIFHSSRAKGEFDLQDDDFALDILNGAWRTHGNNTLEFAKAALRAEKIWGMDLNEVPSLTEKVAEELKVLVQGKLADRITEVVGG